MRRSLVAAFAALCVAFAIAAPSAQGYSISPTGAIAATSNGGITLRSTLWTFSCDYQLQGAITASSANVGDVIGEITSGTITRCLGGISIRPLFPGPWQIVLTRALGSGPLTGAAIQINGWAFGMASPPCLYSGNISALADQASGGTSTISLLTNSIASACGTASLNGSFTLSPGITIS